MTKNQIKGVLNAHKMSDNYQLSDCYNNHSYAKQKAYNYCIDLMKKHNGYDFKIIGHNRMMFSAGFYFVNSDGATKFMYITKSYVRISSID